MSLELEVVKKVLPRSHATMITQDFLDRIEHSIDNTEIAESFKENFITYSKVLQQGKYKIDSYVNAVKYVSYKLLGYSNIDAYAATFPDRYAKLKKSGSNIDGYVSMYNGGKLVNLIYEQTLVPSYVLNAPYHQEAINTLVEMIRDPSVKGMTKVKACEAVIAATKAPEITKSELSINVEQSDTINELRDVTEKLAGTLRDTLMGKKTSLSDIASMRIVDVSSNESSE